MEKKYRDIPPQTLGLADVEYEYNASYYGRRQSNSILHAISGYTGDAPDAVGSVFESKSHVEHTHVKHESPPCFDEAKFFQYNMRHKHRGIFVIFNHKGFTTKKNLPERQGTDVDRDNLSKTAQKLGFKVFTHDNLTIKNVRNEIAQYAQRDYSDSDCFACAILTHGCDDDTVYAKDGPYPIQDLFEPMRDSLTLTGKPKLFFVQACRGQEIDCGRPGVRGVIESDCPIVETCDRETKSIPIEADFFIGYSTVKGYFAWRNGGDGSWFIQALCHCLEKYSSHMELMQIMTRVNRMVAFDFESDVPDTPEYNKKKQMPSIVTRLTGDVYFNTPEKPNKHYETTDGIMVSIKKSLRHGKSLQASPQTATKVLRVEKESKKQDVPQDKVLQKQMLTARLELIRMGKKKKEIEMEENKLQEKMCEYELEMLNT